MKPDWPRQELDVYSPLDIPPIIRAAYTAIILIILPSRSQAAL